MAPPSAAQAQSEVKWCAAGSEARAEASSCTSTHSACHPGSTTAADADGSTAGGDADGSTAGGDADVGFVRLSKQEKKALRHARRQEHFTHRKAQKKLAMKAAKEASRLKSQAEWDALTPAEQEAFRAQAAAERASREARQEADAAVRDARSAAAPTVAIDLDFEDLMDKRETISLCQQLLYAYGANRRSEAPVKYHLCACRGAVRAQLERMNGFANWQLTRHEEDYSDVFPRDRLVYLSSGRHTPPFPICRTPFPPYVRN